tara:strand:+ start:1661 stop:2014 length:354 start_codon:yes stop_codon:yes gene_type:complete
MIRFKPVQEAGTGLNESVEWILYHEADYKNPIAVLTDYEVGPLVETWLKLHPEAAKEMFRRAGLEDPAYREQVRQAQLHQYEPQPRPRYEPRRVIKPADHGLSINEILEFCRATDGG